MIILASLVGGCADKDSVLFVTDTSLGIEVDSKPATTSIAYDRVEGFIGPRYQNGAVPPVVASIATGGSIFNPRIQQVYATGAAAEKVTGGSTDDGPKALQGDPTMKKLVFFGTTTTVGLKATFTTGVVPDSMNFGYKRKEFSFIPLASTTTNGGIVDVYPSVLASIDSSTKVASGSSGGSGLTNQQFFATGTAAEALATNPEVVSSFRSITANAVTASLTTEQLATATALGNQQAETQNKNLDSILAAVSTNNSLDASKLSTLVDKANAAAPNSVPTDLKQTPSLAALKARLATQQPIVKELAAQLPI
jgi:hypothetical protein